MTTPIIRERDTGALVNHEDIAKLALNLGKSYSLRVTDGAKFVVQADILADAISVLEQLAESMKPRETGIPAAMAMPYGNKKVLTSKLDTKNDSISYTVVGEDKPLYVVDSGGYLFMHDKCIGKYSLRDGAWHLYLNDPAGIKVPELYMSSEPNTLFKLPEFELESLTKLVNL